MRLEKEGLIARPRRSFPAAFPACPREVVFTIKTRGIYHMGIPVNDMDRAVRFYTEVLGMTVAKLNRDDMGGRLERADLRCGDGMVVLFKRPNPSERNALEENGATHQAFIVDQKDFELAVKKMKDWGVKIHEIPTVERPTGRGFYFFDTEGNLLQLYAPPGDGKTITR